MKRFWALERALEAGGLKAPPRPSPGREGTGPAFGWEDGVPEAAAGPGERESAHRYNFRKQVLRVQKTC